MLMKEGIKMYLGDAFKRVLVLSPHADDDVIGCGGLMKKRSLITAERYMLLLQLLVISISII
jgi:hypothetical protein